MEQFIVYTLIGLGFGVFFITDTRFQELAREEREPDPFWFDTKILIASWLFWPVILLRSMFHVLSKN